MTSKNRGQKAFSLIELSIVILVIGVLIAGVVKGSSIINKTKLSVAKSLTTSSPVPSIKNLTLWLETTGAFDDAVVNTFEDGEIISSWHDSNPTAAFKKNLVTGIDNDATDPTYEENGISGLPSIRFNATIDGVTGSSLLTSETPVQLGDSSYTYFIVLAQESFSTSAVAVFNQGTKSVGLYLGGGGGVTVYTGLATDVSVGSIKAGKGSIFAARFDNTNDVRIFNNSNSVTTVAMPSGTPNIVSDNFNIGAYLGNYFFQGLISEIIVYDRSLKTEEIQDVNSYLAKKYKIALN